MAAGGAALLAPAACGAAGAFLLVAALGAVLQPAVFKLYGRLPGPLSDRAEDLTRAALATLGL